MNKLFIPAILAATVLVAGMFAVMPVQKASTVHSTIISSVVGKREVVQSELLSGLTAGAVFPFLDSTPHHIISAHIAITDSTTTCSTTGGTAPAKVQVLVGTAMPANLVNVMTAATNIGVGSAAQCVFHVTITPGLGGVPSTVTDIVVVNASNSTLTGTNTVSASAEIDNS